MPIKIPNRLPARSVLEGENIFIMDEDRAYSQDIRPLKLLLLNLMPTKIITETQLLRLLGNTPLQVEIGHLGKVLGVAALAIAAVVVATILLISDIEGLADVVTVLLLGVSLAVAAVPEGLPAILSVVLAMGVRRAIQALPPSPKADAVRGALLLGVDACPGYGKELVDAGTLTASVQMPANADVALESLHRFWDRGTPVPLRTLTEPLPYPR